MKITHLDWGGWASIRLETPDWALVAPLEIGPRILSFGRPGGPNLLFSNPPDLGARGGSDWRIYGGHRLWLAPEHPVRTYHPDNEPVRFEEIEGGCRLVQAPDPEGLVKSISLLPEGAGLRLVHRLENHSTLTIDGAAWALTALAPGGEARIPLPPRGQHPADLLPDRALVLWPYTDLGQPCFSWANGELRLRQGPPSPQKIGLTASLGIAHYHLGSTVFTKRFPTGGPGWPDMGCHLEAFTNARMLELESLGPLAHLAPGEAVEHEEGWSLSGA